MRILAGIAKSLQLFFVLLTFTCTWAHAGEVLEVSINKMQFTPQKIQVKAGTTVKWLNNEKRTNHSVFFEQEGLPESDRLFPGESWQRTFDKPGTYPYRCGPHPEMTGVVEVAE